MYQNLHEMGTKKRISRYNAFEDFGVAKTRSEIIWISEYELAQLIKYEPIDKHVRRTRLVFLFMLYTAQRFSDYRHVRRKDLVINQDGTVDWHLFQRKQSKTYKVVVPIIEPAVEILDQLRFREMVPNDFLVPITCNQSFNRSIKRLCQLAGLDTPVTTVRIVGNKRIEKTFKKYQLISCHTSRKSWVSLSLEKGLGPDYLASVTGHTNLKTLRNHYVGLNHESKRKAINAAWKSSPEQLPE